MTKRPSPGLLARRSVRDPSHDYSGGYWYHVTICTHRRGSVLGCLRAGVVDLSSLGRLAEEAWASLPIRMPHVRLDEHIVMPDHLHGIVRIWPAQVSGGAVIPERSRFGASQAGRLSLVVNLFKGDVTRAARRLTGEQGLKIWLRGYHERIIRTQAQMAATRTYIRNNPIRG